MGLFSFLKRIKFGQTKQFEPDRDDYLPSFCEDDYCQIEIVPVENKTFIKKKAKEIGELASKSRTNYGLREKISRGLMPVTTASEEFRTDCFEKILADFQFQRASHIRYDKSELLDCARGNTKAFGFSNFAIFFDTEEEFLKNIWLGIGLIVSAPQFDLIENALYELGETYELMLIDWTSLEVFDLADRTRIEKYLMGYWK